jgi:predicted transcriptional regulator
LLDNKKITRKDALKILDLGETKVKELFNNLIKNTLIERMGKGRNTYYRLINNT